MTLIHLRGRNTMLLTDKIAVVYGAGGHIGGAVARAFARRGKRLPPGRTLAKVRKGHRRNHRRRRVAEATELDALDKRRSKRTSTRWSAKAGGIDISFNATSIRGHLQGTPLVEMTLENSPRRSSWDRSTHFLTATAAARHMMTQVRRRRHPHPLLDRRRASPGATRCSTAPAGSVSPARHRISVAHLGRTTRPAGIRVVCLRSDAIPETGRQRATKFPERFRKTKAYMDEARCSAGCRPWPRSRMQRCSRRRTGRAP